jgi:predicted dinucleotide-utilizing enzyme
VPLWLQGVSAFGAAAAPQILRAAVPVGKQLLSAGATVLVAGVGALNDAAAKNRKRRRAREKEEQQHEERD